MSDIKLNVRCFQAIDRQRLEKLEEDWRDLNGTEVLPFAQNQTSFTEIAENIIPDKDGPWKHPLVMIISTHYSNDGVNTLCNKAHSFLMKQSKDNPLDILSITAGMKKNDLLLRILIRPYKNIPDMSLFFDEIGENIIKSKKTQSKTSGKLIIPDDVKNHVYSKKQIEEHEKKYKNQIESAYNKATAELPFLNQIDTYIPKELPNPEDTNELIYDLQTKDMQITTMSSYEKFNQTFKEVMTYVNGIEYYEYMSIMAVSGYERYDLEQQFMDKVKVYVMERYVDKGFFPVEDIPKLMEKLYRSLFQMYVIQDLIDDPLVTDIKITAPNSIRARVRGKAYISNITFIDGADYLRFIKGVSVRNGISLNVPAQTFTDEKDENYILRFSVTAAYVNSVPWPYLHIRKIARKKMMAQELIDAGMMDEKLRDYLLDCGKNSRGVVFAGPPGSGKTVILNWFLEEAYEQSAEILVIQENDELFTNRKGVMFQHVVNYPKEGEVACSLEDLGKLALVAGANVFVIGEAKGGEICSAITLSNSGCRTALTIHSPSSVETVDKMADLAMRGIAQSYEQAKRSLKSFQTIVYLQDFKIQEISEIIGYNEQKKDMEYKYIYKRSVGDIGKQA